MAGTDVDSIITDDIETAFRAVGNGKPAHILVAVAMYCVMTMVIKETGSHKSTLAKVLRR